MKKERLDVLMTARNLAESREKARAIIMSGEVYVDGQRADKPGAAFPETAAVEVRGGTLPYVSRGGLKLERALDAFGVDPAGLCCLDCGASTGGFTDCLLQRGARKVYAVDVGYGQLAWKIRNDPRVVVLERTNIRYAEPAQYPEPPELATIDVSFISLSLVLPALRKICAPDARAVCLIKPQFEAGRDRVGKKGVVRDPQTHIDVLRAFAENAGASGFSVRSLTWSPIKGPEGNIEFLGYLAPGGADAAPDIDAVVSAAHEELS